MTTPRDDRRPGDDAERDAWLSEALRHAPDAGAAPPSAVSDAILREARAAARPSIRTPPPRAPNALAHAWAWLARPPVAAGFASVMVATFAGVMWWGQPLDETLRPPPMAPRPSASIAPPSPAAPASTQADPAPAESSAVEAAKSRDAPAAKHSSAATNPQAQAGSTNPEPTPSPEAAPAPAPAPAPGPAPAQGTATANAPGPRPAHSRSAAPATAPERSAAPASTRAGQAAANTTADPTADPAASPALVRPSMPPTERATEHAAAPAPASPTEDKPASDHRTARASQLAALRDRRSESAPGTNDAVRDEPPRARETESSLFAKSAPPPAVRADAAAAGAKEATPADDVDALASIREAFDSIAAQPQRWAARRDAGVGQPVSRALQAWTAQLDATTHGRWRLGNSSGSETAAQGPSAQSTQIRFYRDGELRATIRIDGSGAWFATLPSPAPFAAQSASRSGGAMPATTSTGGRRLFAPLTSDATAALKAALERATR